MQYGRKFARLVLDDLCTVVYSLCQPVDHEETTLE